MSDERCCCNLSAKELPLVIGGIVVYELAIIIVLLLLILTSEESCNCNNSCSAE